MATCLNELCVCACLGTVTGTVEYTGLSLVKGEVHVVFRIQVHDGQRTPTTLGPSTESRQQAHPG